MSRRSPNLGLPYVPRRVFFLNACQGVVSPKIGHLSEFFKMQLDDPDKLQNETLCRVFKMVKMSIPLTLANFVSECWTMNSIGLSIAYTAKI